MATLPCLPIQFPIRLPGRVFIYDPPLVLYVKGELTAKDKNAVAMVGSRQTTHYGIESVRKLAYQLAYVGVTVVSGGARGIDTAAHQGALSAKGRTVAILGTGINPFNPHQTGCAGIFAGTFIWRGVLNFEFFKPIRETYAESYKNNVTYHFPQLALPPLPPLEI